MKLGDPDAANKLSFPPTQGGSTSNLALIRQAVSEKKMFEIRLSQDQMQFFLPEPCYMLLSCTLKDVHPLFFIQASADVLPFKCLRGESC